MSEVFTSQLGLKQKALGTKKLDFTTDNLFAGMWRLDQANLDKFDPFITGYSLIIWTKLPAFFDTEIKRQFQALTEKNFKGYSGIGNINLQVDNIVGGFTGNEIGVATGITKENTSFSLKHQELAGSPVRELYQYWISGMFDIETGVSHYHGKIESGQLDFSMKNHTGELLYIVTDPSFALGGASGIEFAAYYTNVFPTMIPQDHLNYSVNDHSLPEIDIEFRGNFHQSKEINELAVTAMKSYTIKKRFGDYRLGKGFSVNNGYNEDAGY